jgi:hypothetical protein
MSTPTEAEDTAAVTAALEGIDDPEEVRRLVVAVRAMLGLREADAPSPAPDMPILMLGVTAQSMRPLTPEMTVAEMVRQLRSDIPDFELPSG